MRSVHATAIVHPRAELADHVEIGPYCHVDAGVRVGEGTRLLSHAVLMGNTTLGEDNTVFPFAVIGGPAQLRKEGSADDARRGALRIGDSNVFREHVTVNVSTTAAATTIGSHNLFMAGAHVAHDVAVGSRCVVANGVQLAGHVTVEDWVTFGGLAAVAQRLRIGQSAFVAGGAMCERDVPPFVIAQGDRARVRALNVVGLRRRGVAEPSIAALDRSDPLVAHLAGWVQRGGSGPGPA